MKAEQIKAIQEKIGVTPDGFWGPKSIAAAQAHLHSLMPTPNPWPSQRESALQAFYGDAGDESQLVNLDVSALPVRYEGARVKTIRCHKKIAPALLRVLQAIAASPFVGILGEYAGCFNFRVMRGGSNYSLHARGAAIDLDADNNGNLQHWPAQASMPFEVMEMFAREGALSAGAFWGRDGMHAQFTQ